MALLKVVENRFFRIFKLKILTKSKMFIFFRNAYSLFRVEREILKFYIPKRSRGVTPEMEVPENWNYFKLMIYYNYQKGGMWKVILTNT